jgi:5'-deoxynucleotidase
MKFINRWALMRNTYSENLSEHSLDTAILAHALAVIKNKRFGGNVNAEQAALLAIFHDASEILTGDMPTPVKYFNEEIRSSYKQVEESACARLLSMLPEDLRPEYEPLILHREDQELHSIVKAADKLSALIKCIEERKAGNMEFANAEKATLEAIKRLNLPELNCFLEELLPAYMLTLDEQGMSR